MSVDVLGHHPDPRALRREPVIPSGVLGMLIFVVSEVMFFTGLISAFLIVKESAPSGIWPPPGQPRLPVGTTAINTLMLLASGVSLLLAERAYRSKGARTKPLVMGAMALGAFFVIAQGREWLALIQEGLTLTSSSHGGFFYTIVGAHGLHAVAALIGLGWVLRRLLRGELLLRELQTALVFWLFVVGVWPVLYWQVYL